MSSLLEFEGAEVIWWNSFTFFNPKICIMRGPFLHKVVSKNMHHINSAPSSFHNWCSIHVLSHFYFDIKFGDRIYSKEKRRAWPLLFWIWSVAKIDIKVTVTTWICLKTLLFTNSDLRIHVGRYLNNFWRPFCHTSHNSKKLTP